MLLGLTYSEIAIVAAVFAVSTAVTTGMVAWFLVGIRQDYFVAGTRGLSVRLASPVTRAFYAVGKNLLGGFLVIMGIVLSLPGVPGPGLITMLVGLLLMDIPGKRRFELAIVRRDAIRRNIDRLRKRFGREPLEIDPPSERGAHES